MTFVVVVYLAESFCAHAGRSENVGREGAAAVGSPMGVTASKADVKKIGKDLYRIGLVTIDAKKKEIRFPAWVNMDRGLVELLLCSRTGKLHESVLATNAEPIHIQVALLLLGLKPGKHPFCDKKDPRPVGDMVDVFVVFGKTGAKKTVRGEDLIWNKPKKRAMRHTPWVFLGSRIYEGRFCAQSLGSIITTYHDPLAILDNPLETTTDDTLYFVNEKMRLKRGEHVTVILRPAPTVKKKGTTCKDQAGREKLERNRRK